MKTVLICGIDGYIGHALGLKLNAEGCCVIGIDSYSRRINVECMGSFSALPLLQNRIILNSFMESNLNNYQVLRRNLSLTKPDIIVNLAQQPSAPFSHRDFYSAANTTTNNLMGTFNLLWAIREINLDTHLIQIGSMGEYQPDVGTDIAEGVFRFNYNGRTSEESIFPRRPGSWYHASKVAATYYIDAACRWWGLRATDIMQGIVYGAWTPEIEKTGSFTRLDSDEAFGTVVHRFIIQAVLGEPLTIYGKGEQKRGFLSLNDSVQALYLAITNPSEKGYRTWNQLASVYSINEIADTVIKIIGGEKEYIESPRKENTEEHYYNPITDNLKKLGFKQTRTLEDEIRYIYELLKDRKAELEPLRQVVKPKIKW